MPTAEEFEQAASKLDAVGDETAALMRPVAAAMGDDVMTGGRLTETVERFIDERTADSRAIAADFGNLADECRRRAEVVREAEREQREYEALVELVEALKAKREAGIELEGFEALFVDVTPEPPDPPPPWAEF